MFATPFISGHAVVTTVVVVTGGEENIEATAAFLRRFRNSNSSAQLAMQVLEALQPDGRASTTSSTAWEDFAAAFKRSVDVYCQQPQHTLRQTAETAMSGECEDEWQRLRAYACAAAASREGGCRHGKEEGDEEDTLAAWIKIL